MAEEFTPAGAADSQAFLPTVVIRALRGETPGVEVGGNIADPRMAFDMLCLALIASGVSGRVPKEDVLAGLMQAYEAIVVSHALAAANHGQDAPRIVPARAIPRMDPRFARGGA